MQVLPVPPGFNCSSCGYDLVGLDADGRCPECGRAVSLTLPRCPRCPRLHEVWIPLRRMEHEDAAVWECERCGGLGFERGELSGAVQRAPIGGVDDRVHDMSLQAAAHCGRCIVAMSQVTIDANTIIDRCEGCGFVWIDFGELPSVVLRARRELAGREAPPQLDEWLAHPSKLEEWRRTSDRKGAARMPIIEVILGVIFGSIG